MTAAEVTPERNASGEGREAQSASPTHARPPPASPLLSAAWLLRVAAFCAVAAATMGVIVAPGVRGNASERAVVESEWASAALAYFLDGVLVALLLWGALELVRTRAIGAFARAALIGAAAAVVAMSSPGLRDRLPVQLALLVAAAAAVAAIAGGYVSARVPHTRALGGVLFALAFASVARLAAWELATAAGERASVQLFGTSRILATAGVLFEASAQMVVVTWLTARSRSAGQLGSTAALVAAFAATWGVARGVHSGASPWQAILHTALADAPGMPPPYGLDAVATFLVPASLLLALVTAAQPKQVAGVVAPVALALVSRGAFDAPLRALCAIAAAQWGALACVDERAMWRTLIDGRARRLADEGVTESAPVRRGP
jgi:hypothetical protein